MSEDIKVAFENARKRVAGMQRDGADAAAVVEAHTGDVDAIVTGAYERALGECAISSEGLALIALGGYGRGELAPCSDLDLLLLHRGRDMDDVAGLNRHLTYPLWDSGRELGNRVREPRDVLRSFDRIDEVCAVLDARLLAGDRGLFDDLVTSVSRRLERGRASFVAALRDSMTARHERFGHGGHLLEPNIRDSAGGLRDIQTLGWAAKVLPAGQDIEGLVATGLLSGLDAELLEAAQSFLTRLRIELHLLTRRHQDQLHMSEQDALAPQLGFVDEGRPAAERLMQELFVHARQTEAIVTAFWDRTPTTSRRRRLFPARRRTSASQPVGDGCVSIDGRIEVVAVTRLEEDPVGWMRVFSRSVREGAPVGRTSLNRLQEELGHLSVPAWSQGARDVFVDILSSGDQATRVLEQMDLAGFLVAFIPEWAAIRAYPQRDLYHRFTVDRHLFATVAELAASRESPQGDLREAWSKAGNGSVFVVGALLHDVGKGRGGDHSTIGAEIARDVALSMQFSSEEAEHVAFLVAHHLLLAETAVRRDLSDPATIQEVAATVGDAGRLAELYLLTRADSLATGPQAWSSFRASLVRELYSATARLLAGGEPEAASDDLQAAELEKLLDLSSSPLADGEVRTRARKVANTDELLVAAADRPGLFSRVAGVLALRGIDVHDADIYTRPDGVAVESFRVVGKHDEISADRWARVQSDIVATLESRLDIDGALAAKLEQDRRRRWRDHQGGAVEVVADNRASESHTIIEVHAPDQLGLLHTIAKALADAGCDLSTAKVTTYGTRVVDVFYVRNSDGTKITDEDRLSAMAREVERSVVAKGSR